ncbi:myb domain-containing protein [Naegleria gruberi]|uniref:Myb domain-containing protein n=1 Tax=Naegleria gruberi TaxID=5762 RepID=D2VE51_NAEGR|nr:myb domain-containing protein [Naegleria gruberi]EFC44735.1 myb domain-containing protein [Naegleria gruberi]|eukprot:XP_002677479.1 myb domain-containing protein [Naegleria gruberi strain NEG-M]
MSEGRSRIHEHDEELTDEETRDVELGGNSANDNHHHHNRLHYYERDEVSRVNHERGKQFKTLAGRLAWVVICFTIFVLLLLIILYSIRSAYLFSYDESYTSSIEKTPSLNVQVYTTGRRDRVLFNYLTKVDDSRKKPTKGNMYLEMDDNGNTKPTLLFVNPFPESCEGAFLPAITELKADFTIHCINLRGFGTTESTNANDDNYLTLAAMANELAVIVETKKPQDELILIGQEFSGTIIYLLLHQKGKTWVDNYLKAVILLNSPHPKIYSSLLIANERQKFFTQKVERILQSHTKKMSPHTNVLHNQQQEEHQVDSDSEGDAIMSESSKDNQHQLEKNNLINDHSLDDVTNSINNNLIIIPDDSNNNNNLISEGNNTSTNNNTNNNEIEMYDDWYKEEHIQFLQAFKRYGTDWEKVMQCLPSRNDLEQVKSHGIRYLQNGKLGPAYYEYVERQEQIRESAMNDSISDEEESDEEDAIVRHSPYLTTPESLASAFLTNRESVREWNLETRRFETNVEKVKNKEPVDCSAASSSSLHTDKLSLIQSNYGELLDTLDVEKQTQMMDEEVKLMRQDYRMKKLTPFERIVVQESREKIEQLIGKQVQDEPPIIEPISIIESNPQSLNDEDTQTNGALPSASNNSTPSTTTANNNPTIVTPPINPELLTNQPNFRNIYTFLGALFEPTRYDTEELGAMLSPQEKEILQILLHNLSITLSTQQFQEEYSTYVQQISSSQTLRQQQQQQASSNLAVNPANNASSSTSNDTTTTNNETTAVNASTSIVNPFAGQSQMSMLQLLSSEDPQQHPPPFNNINFF